MLTRNLVFLIFFVTTVLGYERNFLKIENCSSSGKSLTFEKCEIAENRLIVHQTKLTFFKILKVNFILINFSSLFSLLFLE